MNNFPKIIFMFLLGLSLTLAQAKTEIVLGDIELPKNINLPNFVPEPNQDSSEIIISRKQYVLSYNREHRAVNWAAWKLELDGISHVGRVGVFAQDTLLDNYLNQFSEHAVIENEFKGSCYDRGHQVPSADRDDTVENNQATFLMSNMIPQTAFLNRGPWARLENYARDLVDNHGKKLFMIAGPIYDEDFGKIGPEKNIPVPSKNFKIIFILESTQTAADISSSTENIAVVMPNILPSGKKPPEDPKELCSHLQVGVKLDTNWQKYKTTIENIESLSGFKFIRR